MILKDDRMRNVFPRERGKDYNHSTFCDLVTCGLVGVRPLGKGSGLVVRAEKFCK